MRMPGRPSARPGTLAMLNRQVLGGAYDVPRLLGLARDTFGARAAELVTEEPAGVATSVVVPAGAGGWLVLEGASLGPRERSVAAAFASHVGVLREREELARQSMAAQQLEAGNRTRTALLAAVSHDLRTPLAGLRSATETLQTHDAPARRGRAPRAARRHGVVDRAARPRWSATCST